MQLPANPKPEPGTLAANLADLSSAGHELSEALRAEVERSIDAFRPLADALSGMTITPLLLRHPEITLEPDRVLSEHPAK